MSKIRLDVFMAQTSLVASRSQAESYIKLGKVKLNGQTVSKSGILVSPSDKIDLLVDEQYVGRAGLKLAGAAEVFGLDFANKTVLDVGSSTGGFTDYALRHDAKRVIAVDVGSHQLHQKLRHDPRLELHEQTDVRHLTRDQGAGNRVQETGNRVQGLVDRRWKVEDSGGAGSRERATQVVIKDRLDIILIDVSFISLRQVLPAVLKLSQPATDIVAMVKPQFEAEKAQLTKGVVKNERLRRDIFKAFEAWTKNYFVINKKADSPIQGEKGNLERFYWLKTPKT